MVIRILLILMFCVSNLSALMIFHYDEQGYFLKSGEAKISPLDHRDLIPKRATTIKPLDYGKNEEAKFINNEWIIVESRESIRIKKEELQAERDRCMQYFDEYGVCLYKKIGEKVYPRTEEEMQEARIGIEIQRLKKVKDKNEYDELKYQARINLGLGEK